MNTDINSVIIPIIIAILLWLVGLTVVFYRLLSHYRRIASKVSQGDLVDLVNKLLDSNDSTQKELSSVTKEIKNINQHLRSPIQKVGLKKYNPFSETGGDQSFSLCLLNMDDDGFVITCLHTRDRTRVYLKPIKAGVSKYDLSEEENQAIKIATK